MRLIRQPPASKLCGQCVVAMAGGISLVKAIELIGHQKGTRAKALAQALRKLGLKVPRNRLIRINRKQPTPRRCILKMTFEGSKRIWGHWILRWDGLDYDPLNRGLVYWATLKPRLTSYLEIR